MHVKHRNESKVPLSVLLDRVDYDRDTGVFTWRHCGPEHFVSEHAWRVWTAKFAGKMVRKRSRGYVVIVISHSGGVCYCMGHRAAWAILHGAWPDGEIDHKNRVRDDNRPDNLRMADHQRNQWNKGTSLRNRSGFKGVHQHSQNGTWIAQFTKNGRTRHLGSFTTPEAAAAAYATASAAAQGHFHPGTTA